MRKRLNVVKAYHAGEDFDAIRAQQGVSVQSARKYVNEFIEGGIEYLCRKTVRNQPGKLTAIQEAAFKTTLLTKKPKDAGMEGNIWTGRLMRDHIRHTYGVSYKGGIYDLLERLNLSHQKAHSDYGNASKDDQQRYIEDLRKTLLESGEDTAVLKFDEFSIGQQPTPLLRVGRKKHPSDIHHQ